MKLTYEELDAKVRQFATEMRQKYSIDALVTEIEELPETEQMFDSCGWDMEEYRTESRKRFVPSELELLIERARKELPADEFNDIMAKFEQMAKEQE